MNRAPVAPSPRLPNHLAAGLLALSCCATALASDAPLLVEQGSSWRYFVNAQPPPITWVFSWFDDSTWDVGPAELGFGEGDEATVVGYGPDPDNKYVTTWFRHQFVLSALGDYNRIAIGLLRDDGAAVYVNGVEVMRNNLPEGPLTADTLAVTNVYGAGERTFYVDTAPASVLQVGTNVVAVEVHQAGRDSLDLSFDLWIAGTNVVDATRGPYLQSGGPHSVVIRWRTATPSDSVVRYGTAPDRLGKVVFDETHTTEHIVRLTGLEPDTRYYYAFGSSRAETSGPQYTFITVPTHTRPIRIWAIGDAGTGDHRQRAVRDAYYRFNGTNHTDVWLMLGDNAYWTGTDTEYQAAVFEMYADILPNTLLYPAIGNHDTYSGTLEEFPYLNIFTLPSQGEAGGVPSGTPRYYSFDYANVHFVCLDSMTSDRSTNGVMCTWLREDLAAQTNEWIIAYWHHPPYSKGSHDSDWETALIEMRENVVPILEAYGVDLVLCGHSHSYERSYLLYGHYGYSYEFKPEMKLDFGNGREDGDGPYLKRGTDPKQSRGTVYVVAGSSGQGPSGGRFNHPAMYISLNVLGSMVIDVAGPRLHARFLRDTGVVDDHFTIIKGVTNSVLRITSTDVAEGMVRLEWLSEPGKVYRIERTFDLNSDLWDVAETNIPSGGNRTAWEEPWDFFSDAVYYRVVEEGP